MLKDFIKYCFAVQMFFCAGVYMVEAGEMQNRISVLKKDGILYVRSYFSDDKDVVVLVGRGSSSRMAHVL